MEILIFFLVVIGFALLLKLYDMFVDIHDEDFDPHKTQL